MRNDPRSLRTMGWVMLAMIPLLGVGLAIIAWLGAARSIGRYGHTDAFPTVIAIALFVGLAPMLLFRGVSVLRVGQRHVLEGGGHRCQCLGCGRDLTPTGPASALPLSMRQLPAERVNAGIGALLGNAGLALAGLALIAFAFATDGLSVAGFVGGALLLAALLTLPLGVWALISGRRQQELGLAQPCFCRWCGAPGQPVPRQDLR